MSALYGRRVTRWLNKIQFTDFYLIWSFFCSIATSACSVERGRAQWERRKERCDKQQEGQRVKEDISWKQTASLFFFLPFCFFEILFFHHFGWPRFSLFASLFRQCNSRVCCAPQQTVSRGSRIREERETLLLIHQPTQLRRMKIVCHEPSRGISHSFALPSYVYRSTDDVMVDSRGSSAFTDLTMSARASSSPNPVKCCDAHDQFR